MNPLRSLYGRQPVLTVYGLLMLVAAAVTLFMQTVDLRQFDGVDVWIKPAKFCLSVGVFTLTSAWFFGYVRPERRNTFGLRYVVWATVIFGTFENGWITWQAAHAAGSHFNTSSVFTIVMYALMGLGAVLLVATTLPLAWEIARHPGKDLRPDYRFAVVAGLLLTFVLGGGMGGYMGAQHGHFVGLNAGHFPLFGWNRSGGDLRVGHFFGMHFEQILPILAALLASLGLRWRWVVLGLAMAGEMALTVFVWLQAVAGQPFLAGIG